MVSHSVPRLHDYQVEAPREGGQGLAVGQDAQVTERERGAVQSRALPAVHRLLGEAEITARPPANLDDHERRRRPGLDGEQVDLRPSHPELACEDGPALRLQPGSHNGFGIVAGPLRRCPPRRGPHQASLMDGAYPAITSCA